MNRKLLCAVMIAGASLLGAGCADKAMDDSLTIANYRDIRDLNPHLYAGEIFAQNLLFEGLIQLAEDGSLQPWLARSWSISPDGKTYTFQLRDDVTFSDGTPFNAHVVKKNFDALMDNVSRHAWLESVRLMHEVKESGVEPVRVLDDHTVEVQFSDVYYPFLVELGVTRPFRFISPACFIEGTTKNGVSCLNGTGSYVLKDNTIDQMATFVRNPNYWGVMPEIETIYAKVIPDNQARILALHSGDVDMVYGLQLISAQTYSQFSQNDNFGVALSQPVSTRMLVINTTKPSLNDVRVRQALTHLTNKVAIADNIMQGLEQPADNLLARNIPYADIDLKPYTFDMAKAEALLDAAGWIKDGSVRKKDGQPLTVTLSFDSDKVVERTIAQYLQSEWEKAGIQLKLLGEEEQAHRDRLKAGSFDISFNISWGTPYDPQSFMGAMRTPVYGDMIAQQGLKDKAKIDQAILDALKTVDEAQRQQYYSYILQTLHDEAVYIPLTYEQNRAIFNNKVSGVGFNPSQFEIPLQQMQIQ